MKHKYYEYYRYWCKQFPKEDIPIQACLIVPPCKITVDDIKRAKELFDL